MLNLTEDDINKAIDDSYGIKNTVMKKLNICHKTLTNYLKKYPHLDERLKQEKINAIGYVESKMFERIEEGSDPMIMFFLKTQAGYRETNKIEHTNPDGSMREPVLIILPDNHREEKVVQPLIKGKDDNN